VTDHNGFVQLNALVEELRLGLEIASLTDKFHLSHKSGVIWGWGNDTREQIVGDTVVKRNIVLGELGQVDIVQSTQADLVLGPIQLSTQVTASSQDSLEGAHTEIIMILGGELFGGKFQGSDNLDSNVTSSGVTEGGQLNLTNKDVVGHHHGAGSEKSLQVIGELSTTSVTGVHGNVDLARSVKLELGTLEDEGSQVLHNGGLDSQNLLGNDGQHFEIDSVELVETVPATR